MTTVPIMWTPDTGTTELPRWRRGVPLADQPTHELLVATKPPLLEPAPTRWSWWARSLAALAIVNVAGLAYAAVTW